eukprot:TRINITY_DN4715_c0_g1_i1.p1 TRINITY_DN4715_c0_g1~~TRINITY_DN4715_c0_g1_i1.p1  ORF type:complete len:231 (+),score=38.79 TRINITY_DN4715_c0_g1_i1:40-693(+)
MDQILLLEANSQVQVDVYSRMDVVQFGATTIQEPGSTRGFFDPEQDPYLVHEFHMKLLRYLDTTENLIIDNFATINYTIHDASQKRYFLEILDTFRALLYGVRSMSLLQCGFHEHALEWGNKQFEQQAIVVNRPDTVPNLPLGTILSMIVFQVCGKLDKVGRGEALLEKNQYPIISILKRKVSQVDAPRDVDVKPYSKLIDQPQLPYQHVNTHGLFP